MKLSPRDATQVAVFQSLPDDARTKLPVVCTLFGISPATAWRKVKSGAIPAPHKWGGGTFWRVAELRAALRAKDTAPTGPTAKAGFEAVAVGPTASGSR